MIIPTILGVAQKRQSVSEVPFPVAKDDSTEEDIQGLRADRMDEPCQSGNFCFNSSKISRAVMDNALEMRTVVYVIYRGLYEDGGSLENHAVGSHDAIGKCIAILGPLVHISVEFSPRTSRPNQRFPASLKMPSLCATGDAIIGRRQ